MNSEEFEVNGRILIRSTYLDISVIIDKETGYYYAQKICDDNRKRMEHLLENNDYELMKQAVASTTGIPVVDLEITFPGMPVGYRSKWVHKLLVNYIAQWANKEYAVKIAMLLNLIDERLKLENRTLQQEINSERRLVEQLQTDNGNLNRRINELQQQNQTIIAQNNQLLEENREQRETIDELYNMNLSSGVTIRSLDKKVNNLVDVGRAIHNQISTIKVKDIKQHKTNDVIILYTSSEKPRDNELRGHTPEGMIWISSFNGQRLNFQPPHIPRDRVVIFESHSNRLDSFKLLLDKPNVARFIQNKTQYRDILIRIDQQDEFLQVIQEELERDDNYPVVNDLEVATLDVVTNEEITFKRNLLERYNPCLINVNRYKRRLYANVNNELVLVEEIENPEQYTWMYRFGPNGSKFGKLDLDMLKTSRFTNELETRINYE